MKTNDQTDRKQIKANAQKLAAVWGDGIPEWNDKTRAVADDARSGTIHFHTNGILPTDVGRRGIAWDGPHHRHQEWRAQLNRFGYLGPLAAGYRATGDEDYVRAARDYIEGRIANANGLLVLEWDDGSTDDFLWNWRWCQMIGAALTGIAARRDPISALRHE